MELRENKQKTKSLLISFVTDIFGIDCFFPDNGLASLASALIVNGHKTKILDFGTLEMRRRLNPPFLTKWNKKLFLEKDKRKRWTTNFVVNLQILLIKNILRIIKWRYTNEVTKKLISKINEEDIDFIGFKLWNGESFRKSCEMVKKIKRQIPLIKIFGGGPAVDIAKDKILKVFNDFDVLVRGEGEETIVQLAEYVVGQRNLEDIPNVIFEKNGEIVTTPIKRIENLDSLPLPVYDEDVYLSLNNNQKIKIIIVEDSRGCPYSCAFCGHSIKSGVKQRSKSPERIVKEIKYYLSRYNVDTFYFGGSNTPKRLIEKVSEKIVEENLKVKFCILTDARSSGGNSFQKMKNAGGISVFFGIESGNQGILDKMKKGIRLEQIKKSVILAKKAGLFVSGSFIYPAPFDNDETKNDTIKFISELALDATNVLFPVIYPGIAWAEDASSYNIEILMSKERFLEYIMFNLCSLYLGCPDKLPPLPYKINGQDFKSLVKEWESMQKTLREKGIKSVDPLYPLIAAKVNIPVDTLDHRINKTLLNGDYRLLEDLIERINLGNRE
ncbi:MAG TPA: radical SAM protein [bacterium]|nr:radical SAM protein [bacterium]